MRLPHHVQPLVGRRLAVAVQQLPHAIHENLGAPARDAVEPCRHQAFDHRWDRKLVEPGDVQDLGRGQRVELEVGIARLDPPKQVLVPRNRQVRIVASLQEQLASAEAILTEDEKELGVALVDIGGGTTDIAIYEKGAVWHTAVLPVGSGLGQCCRA